MAGRDIRCFTYPGDCRAEQWIAFLYWLRRQMIEATQSAGPQLAELSYHPVELSSVFLPWLYVAIDRPRRRNYESGYRFFLILPSIGGEKYMLVVARAVWPAIWFVSREQPVDVAGSVPGERHEGTAQGTDDWRYFLKGDSVSRPQVEDEDVAVSGYGLHQAQTTESTVTDQQGTGNRFTKSKLHVP